MPSSGRALRHNQRRQRFDQLLSAGTGPLQSGSPFQTTPILEEHVPHPYHASSTPPAYARLEHRTPSARSHISDISMDEFSGTHESVLEYSDTSGEDREDAYFLPVDGSRGPLRMPGDETRKSIESSGSAFRELRASHSRSSRVLRLHSDGSPVDPSSERFDDEPDAAAPGEGKKSRAKKRNDEEHEEHAQTTIKTWMTNLAYSFRSPVVSDHKGLQNGTKHKSRPSSSTMEYPFSSLSPRAPMHPMPSVSSSQLEEPVESSPLLVRTAPPEESVEDQPPPPDKPTDEGNGGEQSAPIPDNKDRQFHFKSRTAAVKVAAYFLMDYEAGRPPTLPSKFESITMKQLRLYKVHFSWVWRWLGITPAVTGLFLAHSQSRLGTACWHTYGILFLFLEMWMKEVLYGPKEASNTDHGERNLVRPLSFFIFLLGFESWFSYLYPFNPDTRSPALITSFFKPLVFFYISLKARHALEAILRIGKIVIRVIIIELFLILTFAAVACQSFRGYESFQDLSTSWLSLFELSTTVVNPSLWMPMYEDSRSNATFFIFFLVVSVVYMHSLVLSVVFQTYIQAAGEIHDRSVSDREEAVRRAFLALLRDQEAECITTSSVRKTLQTIRPHYNTMKIKALMDIVDPTGQSIIDYPTFRTKIRQALNASIRTARSTTGFAMGVELIAVLVAASNFVYVILVTSDFSAAWFDAIEVSAGSVITLLGLTELVIRFNPTRIANFTPITRLNATFDGLAFIGATVSCVGIIQYLAGYDGSTHVILMGRAIDMIRIMRFFQIFRDVVRRSADVLPAMTGPLLLACTTIHCFVYMGMALWGGAIDVKELAQNEAITPLYYLNNFNSYPEGLVTIFNVIIVNDWHAIAEVFLYAKRCSSPNIVYPFFVATLCFGVFIMLNVITAFFVESFVAKLEDQRRGYNETHAQSGPARELSIRTGENTNVKRIASSSKLKELSEPADDDPVLSAEESMASSNSTEIFAFDVYEREGFDDIMRTVAGGVSAEEQETFARSVCDHLEVFESLAGDRDKVGYMLCCQQSMHRYGNRRFQNFAKDFIKNDMLHKCVSDMHSELLVLSTRKTFEDRCLVRSFPHQSDPSLQLEISASLLRQQPAVSLFVSSVKPASASDP